VIPSGRDQKSQAGKWQEESSFLNKKKQKNFFHVTHAGG
jgi:hypothetical protein